MALTHAVAAQNAAADAVTALLDAGVGANATLEILDGATVLSAHNMSNPAFGAAAAGVATADSIANATAGNSGTADGWRAKDTDGGVILSGAAGQKWAIVAVATGAGGRFEVAGDHSAEFAAGTDFTVTGSTGNDGYYTVAAVAYNGTSGQTEIDVEADQTVASAVADGHLHVGECGLDNSSITADQTVSISSFTYKPFLS